MTGAEPVTDDDDGGTAHDDVSVLRLAGAEARIFLADQTELFARVRSPLAGGRVVIVPWGLASPVTLARGDIKRAHAAGVESWEEARRIGQRQRVAASSQVSGAVGSGR